MRIYLINQKKRSLIIDKKEKLIQLCKDLRLPSIRKMIKDESEFTNPKQAFEVLLQVLEQEKSDRFIRAKQNRIRSANFPQKKILEELVEEALPEQAQQKLSLIKTLEFIKEGQNIILLDHLEQVKLILRLAWEWMLA